MTPQQHFGKVVQQRGFVDHFGIVIHAMNCEAESEAGRAARAHQHTLQAIKRLRLIAQPFLHAWLRAELAKERTDAHHHQCGGRRFSVGDAA